MENKFLRKWFFYSLSFFLLGSLLDSASTYYMLGVKNLGIKYELNILARWFFENFGIMPGLALHCLVSIVIIITIPHLYFRLFSSKNKMEKIMESRICVICLFAGVGTAGITTSISNVFWYETIIIPLLLIILSSFMTGIALMYYLDKKIQNINSAE